MKQRFLVCMLLLLTVVACRPTVDEGQAAVGDAMTNESTGIPVVSPTLRLTDTPAPTNTISPTDTPLPADTSTPTSLPPPRDTPTSLPTLTSEPTHTSTPKSFPEDTPTPESEILNFTGPDIAFNGVHFSLPPELAGSIYAEISTERVSYTQFPLALDGFCRDVGCVTVYPIDSYREHVLGGEYNVSGMQSAVESGSLNFFPTVGAAILLRAQTEQLSFQNGRGLRALVMRGQDGFLANNEALVYDFQGISDDGNYYISVLIPVDAPPLIDGYDPALNSNDQAIPIPEMPDDYESQAAVIIEYNQEAQRQLDMLDNAQFTPALDLLDALVASLSVVPPE